MESEGEFLVPERGLVSGSRRLLFRPDVGQEHTNVAVPFVDFCDLSAARVLESLMMKQVRLNG